jgi:hypothetical protein
MDDETDEFPITLQQTREIALEIPQQAEVERLECAADEARRGIDSEGETGD